jgi:hypothetical protein
MRVSENPGDGAGICLDSRYAGSLFVRMAVETIGEAFSLGWRVHMRCSWGPRDGMKRVRECAFRCELDLQTLMCTRGAAMPLSLLPERLKCPRCGSRRVSLIYEPPAGSARVMG